MLVNVCSYFLECVFVIGLFFVVEPLEQQRNSATTQLAPEFCQKQTYEVETYNKTLFRDCWGVYDMVIKIELKNEKSFVINITHQRTPQLHNRYLAGR